MGLYSLLVLPGILCIVNRVLAYDCVSGNTCKVNSGENIFLECKDKKPVHWEYPRQDFVPESYEDGDIIEDEDIPEDSEVHASESSTPDKNGLYTANLTITNAIYKDTGFYKCLHKSKHLVKEKYYFVEDDKHLLVHEDFANFNGYLLKEAVIPCKPTDPDVKVSLIKGGGSIIRIGDHDGRKITYDARYGYTIYPAHLSDVGAYTCMAKKGHSQNMTYVLNLQEYMKIKIPMINETSWVPDIREGDDLVIVCSEKASSFEFNWTTPQDPEDERLSFTREDCDDDKTCSILRIHNVTLSDSGQYECGVKDGDLSYSTNKTIFVFGKNDHFLNLQIDYEPSRSQCRKTGAYVTWVIDLRYSEIPELEWYDPNGKVIQTASKFEVITNEEKSRTSLTVNKISVADLGNYTLVAKTPHQQAAYNVSLEVISTLTVWVTSSDKKWKPGQMYEHKKVYNLTCRAKGFPIPELKWIFYPCTIGEKCDDVERPVKPTRFRNPYEEYRYPYRFYAEQSGHLKCIATNKNCNITKMYEIAVRITDVPGNNKELHIWTDPVEVVEKDTVNLTCAASIYNYTNDITWYRLLPGDNLLNISQSSSEYFLDTYSTVYNHWAVLIFYNISQKNDGSYMCKVKNLNGSEDNITYTLNVAKEKTPFLKSSNLNVTELQVRLGLPAMLYCQFRGMPSPQIIWMKDEKQINATGRIQLKHNNETLNITAFQREDEGKYTCFAKNRVGKISKTIMLVEQGKQGIPKPLIAAITLCSIFLIVLLVVLLVKIRKERKLRKELALAGLAHFVKGVPECINPDLPVDEQADLLPYDKKWEFPRERLRLGKQLGAGAFGVVLKAEAQGILPGQEWTTVAVKMAKSGMADRTYLRALASELKIMTHLGQHLNVVNLLGACTKNLARRMELLVIVEFCRYGNLHNYLLRRRDNFVNQVDPDTGEVNLALGQEKLACTPIRLFSRSKSLLKQRLFSFTSNTGQSSAPSSPGPLVTGEDSSGYLVEADECLLSSSSSEQPDWRVRYGGDYKGAQTGPICTQDLICWGFQVARGMEYLASRKVLHGDLAARNLLLADNNVVKICDFGLAKSMYKTDNYRKKGAGPLPVKWMAPESISDRVFSTQSDVWSFGIVLWELFSLAQTPYPGMAADENLYRKLLDGYRMEQPPNATNAIYSIMLRCWEKYPDRRPSFSEIAELLGATLDDNVRRHFEELNDPYIVMNKNYQEGEDYLKMMSAPDYTNMTVKEQNDYINSPESTSQAQDYLQMTGNPKDIFSPRISNEVFEFPSDYLSMTVKQPQDDGTEENSQRERIASGTKYVNLEDKSTAVANPNYR